MADEAIIAAQEAVENKPAVGSVEAEIAKEVQVEQPKHEADTVPLSAFLDLKKDLKQLKKDIKEAKSSQKHSTAVEGVAELSSKYPDVSAEFIADILESATSKAQAEIDKKYTPFIEQQTTKEKQAAFDKAFDALFEKTLKDNPQFPSTIDKEMVKTLAVNQKYRNVPLVDILTNIYGSVQSGRASSETDTRLSSDRLEDIVSFDKITPAQRELVLNDPVMRKKYYNFLDGIK